MEKLTKLDSAFAVHQQIFVTTVGGDSGQKFCVAKIEHVNRVGRDNQVNKNKTQIHGVFSGMHG